MRENSPYITEQQQHQQQQQQEQEQQQQQQRQQQLPPVTLTVRGLPDETVIVRDEGGKGEGVRRGEGEDVIRGKGDDCNQQEMNDTLTPMRETVSPRKPHPMRRASTTSSLRSMSSLKREKPPPLMHSEPLYILRINCRGIAVLPNIQANEISVRASVNHVELEEMRACDVKERANERRSLPQGIWEGNPVIKARIEVGAQVQRFNFVPDQTEQDAVIMLALSGLEAALLLKNTTVLKDFFDDEYEADSPVPIQIRVQDTSFMLRESLDHTTNTDSTMNVQIKAAEIHRGKKVQDTNLFPSQSETSQDAAEETLHLNLSQVAGLRDISPAAASTDSSTSTGTNADLLQTFRSFVRVFESHVRRHGGLKVQLSQPEHIAGLLQELQVSLSEEDMNVEQQRETSDAPPSYTETLENSTAGLQQRLRDMSSQVATVSGNQPRQQSLGSPTMSRPRDRSTELRKLRQDSLELSRVLAENEDLISQLMQTKMLLAERSQDLDEVTSECKKAKDDLVTHKQVLETYQEHIERLLSENADLKMATASS